MKEIGVKVNSMELEKSKMIHKSSLESGVWVQESKGF